MALVVLIPLHLVSAGGQIHLPVASVIVEDRFGSSCNPRPVAGFCLANVSIEGTDPGGWSIDLYQSIAYVGVATNLSAFRGVVFLPDASVRLRFTEYTIPNPLLPLLDPYQDLLPSEPGQELNVTAFYDEEGFTFTIPYPDRVQQPTLHDRWSQKVWWADEKGVGYRQVGPFHEYRSTTPDEGLEAINLYLCRSRDVHLCPASTLATNAVTSRTPHVLVGLDYYTAEVADDPSSLSPPSTAKPTHAPLEGTVPASAAALGTPALASTKQMDAPQLSRIEPEGASGSGGRIAGSVPPASPPPGRSLREALRGNPPAPALASGVAAAAFLALLLAGLYTRLSRQALLTQETRQALLALARSEPGVSPSEAARRLGVDFRAVMYHARLLAKAGELSVVRVPDRRVLLYAAGTRPPGDPADPLHRAARHPVSRAILMAIARSPLATRDDLLEVVPAPRATLHWHLRRLIDAGLVAERTVETRAARLSLPAETRERILDHLLGFPTPESSPQKGGAAMDARRPPGAGTGGARPHVEGRRSVPLPGERRDVPGA